MKTFYAMTKMLESFTRFILSSLFVWITSSGKVELHSKLNADVHGALLLLNYEKLGCYFAGIFFMIFFGL